MAEKNHVEKQPDNQQPENPRKAIREARAARLRVIDGPPKTIKVYAANEDMRRALRHGNGTRFKQALDEPVEWPNDSFTHRRIADGSVRTDGPGSGERAAPDETQNPREQAAANKPKPAEPKAEAEPKARAKQQPEPPPEPPQPAA